MASAKINIIANFAGNAWSALLGIVFVPVYLRYVGVESYGLIGFFASLQAFLYLLDFGLSPTFNRELARLSVSKESGQEMHDLKRTLEIPNWISAIAIFLILAILSPLAANYWLQPREISAKTVTESLWLMSFTLAIQFISGFYAGGLLGLQRQVALNSINAFFGTLRSVGAWLVLAYFSPTIQAFLVWQLLIALIQAIVTVNVLKRSLYSAEAKGRFRKDLLQRLWRFAVGMTSTGILAMILTQTDKVILSHMLPLKDFGYYAIAFTIAATSIGIVIGSITNVIYPNYSRLVALGNQKDLVEYYHHSCQLMSVVLLPNVIVLAMFSYEIVMVWQKNDEIAKNSYQLLTLIAIGSGFNGLITLPYHMQLAHSWTRLSIILNAVAITFLIPIMVVGIYYYGAIGGVIGWIVYNTLFGLIMVTFMHQRILKGEMWKWFSRDILPPLLVTLAVAVVFRYFFYDATSRLFVFVEIGFVLICVLFVATFSTKFTRAWVLRRIFPEKLSD